MREGPGRSPGARCRAVEGGGRDTRPGAGAVWWFGGGVSRRQPRCHLHSVRDQQAAVDHHLRKEIQLERRSHAGLRGSPRRSGGRMRRGSADPTTAPGGGEAGTGAEASPRQPPAPAVVTFLSPSRCVFFSANPLRNRLLRQLAVERQVLSGKAEPSPRCGSPLTPAPPAGPADAAPGRGLAPPRGDAAGGGGGEGTGTRRPGLPAACVWGVRGRGRAAPAKL